MEKAHENRPITCPPVLGRFELASLLGVSKVGIECVHCEFLSSGVFWIFFYCFASPSILSILMDVTAQLPVLHHHKIHTCPGRNQETIAFLRAGTPRTQNCKHTGSQGMCHGPSLSDPLPPSGLRVCVWGGGSGETDCPCLFDSQQGCLCITAFPLPSSPSSSCPLSFLPALLTPPPSYFLRLLVSRLCARDWNKMDKVQP